MSKSFLRATILGSLVTVTACSSGQDASKLAGSQVRKPLLIAMMGGNTSCANDSEGHKSPYGMGSYANFYKLASELEADGQYDVNFFLSCHNSDSAVVYVTSQNPTAIQRMTLEQTPGKLDEIAATLEEPRIFVAGHSYGGWLAMRTVQAMTSPVEVLSTIDPISRVNCTFTNPVGCADAPTDIEHDDRMAISDHSTTWNNWYQDETWYLHSWEMEEADTNTQLFVGHTSMDTQDDVWGSLAAQVRSAIR